MCVLESVHKLAYLPCCRYTDFIVPYRWLFWSDLGDNPKIGRISMDSTNCSTIISSDIVWPSSLAIDYKTLTLFWSDVYLDLLESSNFDGTNRTTLEDTFFSTHMALHFSIKVSSGAIG